MKGLALLACLALSGLPLAPALAQSRSAQSYLRECRADIPVDRRACLEERGTFPKDVAEAWDGRYGAVRNLAFCLADGCWGAVKVDRVEGCAWNLVAEELAPTAAERRAEEQNLSMWCAGIPAPELRKVLENIRQQGFADGGAIRSILVRQTGK
jgi:hypothetical protein